MMKTTNTPRALRKNRREKTSRASSCSSESSGVTSNHIEKKPYASGYEIRILCLYPTIDQGKLAKQWLESAFGSMSPLTSTSIEYYNFALLNHDGIDWAHVIERMRPDIILMIGDGRNLLLSGFRHSLKELISHSSNGKKPWVIFRDLAPQPTLNTSVLLDYLSALTDRNHCEFNAMNGSGTPIPCFRHPRLLLKARKRHE